MLGELDLLLIMTVEPGFGGQSFLDLTLPKIRRARAAIDGSGGRRGAAGRRRHHRRDHHARRRSGADVFVAGSAVYGADDPAEAIERLRAAAKR